MNPLSPSSFTSACAPAASWPSSCSSSRRGWRRNRPTGSRTASPARWARASAAGAASDFLDDTWSTDFNLFLEKGRFRGGIGIEFHRFRTLEPVPFEEVSAVPFYLYGTFSPWPEARVRPYLQARLGLTRLHDQLTLDRSGPGVCGWSYGLAPGVEIDINRSVALDLSLSYLGQQTDTLPLGGGAEIDSLNAFTGRVGLTWRAFGRAGSAGYAGPPLPWGVRRSPGLAIGELLVDLSIASVQNEYFHDSNYVQVSPSTWWRNLERGFEIDTNKFDTNNFYHPWNGALFYSAGRSTGLGFWGSSSLAVAGSFLWECCGETLKMSGNDMVSTSLGGVAMGEMIHRLGSVILDNRDKGASRVLREASIFPFDIVRGSNRLFFRDQYRSPNPEEPLDWRPRRLGALVSLGARRVGNEGELGGEGAKTAPFVDLWVAYGSVFDNERRRPYDSFWMQTQINFTDDVDPAGLMTIRGDVLSKPFGAPGARNGAIALVQHFDYVNQRTWEFGAQSLALGLSRRLRLSRSTRLELHADLLGTVLGSVNSRFEFVDAAREREGVPALGVRARPRRAGGGASPRGRAPRRPGHVPLPVDPRHERHAGERRRRRPRPPDRRPAARARRSAGGSASGSTGSSSCAGATTATRCSSRTTTASRRCAPTPPGGSGASSVSQARRRRRLREVQAGPLQARRGSAPTPRGT